MKAQRTRDAVVACALDLFAEIGFEQTTMEQIAEAAEIGTTTLYRYFPGKEAIVLAPFTSRIGRMAATVDARPRDEPLTASLGFALESFFESDPAWDARARAAQTIVDTAPGPRSLLWDVAAREQTLLREAVGRRLDLPADTIEVALACRDALLVADLVTERWRASDRKRSKLEMAAEVIAHLHEASDVVPELPRRL